MGFLLLAALVWLLDVLGQQLGSPGMSGTAAFLLCVALACWLLGAFIPYGSGAGRRLLVWALALVLLGLGYRSFLKSALASRPGVSMETLGWKPFSPAALQAERGAGHVVFLDFTAEWCWTCKVNEKAVLETASVRSKLEASGVVKMKADWTRMDPEVGKLLRSFGRSGVPLYVVFPPKGPAIVLPEVITPGIVLDALEKEGKEKN
jgi:thiol:disulfide interchange protein DsbD